PTPLYTLSLHDALPISGENPVRFPTLPTGRRPAHKLHSTPQQDRMNLISGKGETSSRLPGPFGLFLPGSCPNNRNRCSPAVFRRSEERRVGKECRSQSW